MRKFNPEAGELSALSSVGKQRDALNRPISSDSYASIIIFLYCQRYITKYTLSNIKHVILIHYKMNLEENDNNTEIFRNGNPDVGNQSTNQNSLIIRDACMGAF